MHFKLFKHLIILINAKGDNDEWKMIIDTTIDTTWLTTVHLRL